MSKTNNSSPVNGANLDGRISARLGSNMHSKWPKDENGKVRHPDPSYQRDYMAGYVAVSGHAPDCFPTLS